MRFTKGKLTVFTLILMLALMMSYTMVLTAQDDDTPPVNILIDSNIVAWDAITTDFNNITSRGEMFLPQVAPNGEDFAVAGFAQITLDLIEETGGVGGGGLPTDIWLYDASADSLISIASQPAGASLDDNVTGAGDTGALVRGTPRWSTDGAQLLWAELRMGSVEPFNRIMVFDVMTRTTTELTRAIPPQAGIPSAIGAYWTDAGVLTTNSEFNPNNSTFTNGFLLFDAETGLEINRIDLTAIDYRDWSLAKTADGRDVITLEIEANVWSIVDPLTGAMASTSIIPVLTNDAPDAVRVRFDPVPEDFGRYGLTVINANAEENALTGMVFSQHHLSLSPDGQLIAVYPQLPSDVEDTVSIFDADGNELYRYEALQGSFINGVAWSYSYLLVDAPFDALFADAVTLEAQPFAFECPQAAPTRLSVGTQATVLDGPPNRVRDSASTEGAVIGQIDAGQVFSVVTGPVCDGEIVWWFVDFNGLQGWTAEGVGQEYFLAPVG